MTTRDERRARLEKLRQEMEAILSEEEEEIVVEHGKEALEGARRRNAKRQPEPLKIPSPPEGGLLPVPEWPKRQDHHWSIIEDRGEIGWPACPRCKSLGKIDPYCNRCGGEGYVCPKCQGDAFVYGDRGLIPCDLCEVAYKREREALRAASGLKGRLLGCSFANFNSDEPGVGESYRKALTWSSNPQYWLTIWGNAGNGKSHLAAAAANRLIEAGRAVEYVTLPELLSYLKQAFNDEEKDSAQDRLERLINIPILVLDDLGAEYMTEWARGEVFKLLNGRYVENKPTMITTNIRPDKMPFRIASRLQEGVIVHNTGKDYRKKISHVGE